MTREVCVGQERLWIALKLWSKGCHGLKFSPLLQCSKSALLWCLSETHFGWYRCRCVIGCVCTGLQKSWFLSNLAELRWSWRMVMPLKMVISSCFLSKATRRICFHTLARSQTAAPRVLPGPAKADGTIWPSAVTSIFISSFVNVSGQRDIIFFCDTWQENPPGDSPTLCACSLVCAGLCHRKGMSLSCCASWSFWPRRSWGAFSLLSFWFNETKSLQAWGSWPPQPFPLGLFYCALKLNNSYFIWQQKSFSNRWIHIKTWVKRVLCGKYYLIFTCKDFPLGWISLTLIDS